MSNENEVIKSLDEVTPLRLTNALRRGGIDAEVTSVEVLLSRSLPVSSVHRLAITYARPVRDSPPTLFLKLNLPAPMGSRSDSIDRPEIAFYQRLAPAIGCPPLIRSYEAAFDDENGRSHLLLEDLTQTHSQPPQNTAPPERMSRLAVEAIARVHRRWWNDPAVGSTVGDVFADEWLKNFIADLEKNVAGFLAIANLSPAQKTVYRALLRNAPTVWGRLTDARGLTVTHGDLHWWNFLYPNDPTTDSVRVFDWQLWHIDLAARDLAFLIALGGFAEPRPEIEDYLLRAYHEALAVEDYSWDALMLDYRRSTIRNLNIPIIFWKQGKHYSTWQEALRRAFEAFERLNCGSILR